MKRQNIKSNGSEPAQQSSLEALSVSDLVRFFKELSDLLKNPHTGNPHLSEALAEVAKLFQSHSKQRLPELLASLKAESQTKRGQRNAVSSPLVGLDLASLDLARVTDLILNQELTKEDLIRLGTQRFGIPRWGLERQNKAAVAQAVEASLRNEESLGIISREASRYGHTRST